MGRKLNLDALTPDQWQRAVGHIGMIGYVLRRRFPHLAKRSGAAVPDPWDAGWYGLLLAARRWHPGRTDTFSQCAYSCVLEWIWKAGLVMDKHRKIEAAAAEERERTRPPDVTDLRIDLAEAVASLTPRERAVFEAWAAAGGSCDDGAPDLPRHDTQGREMSGPTGIRGDRMRQLMRAIKVKLRAKLAAYAGE
jgi:hypothetical protein